MTKIELKADKDNEVSKIMKHLSIDKTKIPLTDEEYLFLKQKLNEHIEKHGITYGFVYNLFMKDVKNEQATSEN